MVRTRGWLVGFVATILIGMCAANAQDPKEKPKDDGLAKELIGYWKLNGNPDDTSGEGRALTASGDPKWKNGLIAKGLEFTGEPSQYATRGADDADFDFGTRPFTIQVWVNFNTLDGEQVLIEKYDGNGQPGWTLTKLGDHRLRFDSDSIGITAGEDGQPNKPDANKWHHVVVVRGAVGADLHETRLYLDHVLIGHRKNYPSKNDTRDASQPLRLGSRATNSGLTLNGTLDEVAIWDRALSPQEIGKLWNGQKGHEIPKPAEPAKPKPEGKD